MFQGWRLKLREAGLAFGDGRLDAAATLLFSDELRSVRGAQLLSRQVSRKLVQKALELLHVGRRNEGWKSLDKAIALCGETNEYLAARDEFVTDAFAQLEKELLHCDTPQAFTTIEELERQNVAGGSMDRFKEIAQRIESSNRLKALGKFGESEQQLTIAITLLTPDSSPQSKAVMQFEDNVSIVARGRQLRVDGERFQALQKELGISMADENWENAAKVADELRILAPANADIVMACQKIDPKLANRRFLSSTVSLQPSRVRTEAAKSQELGRTETDVANSEDAHVKLERDCRIGKRFLLWVDAVGGFLVCLGNEVEIGQATPGHKVDIPILGDVSRRHAKICREGGAYIIDPFHSVKVDGRPITERTLLSDADELELGTGVRMRFRQPHALSATARLEFLSHHRSQPATDAVLLMAESCILGAGWRNHVVCRDWSEDVVIFRQESDLVCRAASGLEIDGEFTKSRGRLSRNSRIVGADFSMSIEELDKWTN